MARGIHCTISARLQQYCLENSLFNRTNPETIREIVPHTKDTPWIFPFKPIAEISECQLRSDNNHSLQTSVINHPTHTIYICDKSSSDTNTLQLTNDDHSAYQPYDLFSTETVDKEAVTDHVVGPVSDTINDELDSRPLTDDSHAAAPEPDDKNTLAVQDDDSDTAPANAESAPTNEQTWALNEAPAGTQWHRKADNPFDIPPSIPPHDWKRLPVKWRAELQAGYKKVRDAVNQARAESAPAGKALAARLKRMQTDLIDDSFAMPCIPFGQNGTKQQRNHNHINAIDPCYSHWQQSTSCSAERRGHRDKLPLREQYPLMGCVARPVNKKEIAMTPAAQAACQKEWDRLREKKVWLEDDVK